MKKWVLFAVVLLLMSVLMGALAMSQTMMQAVPEEVQENRKAKILDIQQVLLAGPAAEPKSGMPCDLYEQSVKEASVEKEEQAAETEPAVPDYPRSICGIENPYADILYKALAGYGLESWYSIALAQCFQESHFNCRAVAPNGLDRGLFQFRITFWQKTARQAGIEVNDESIYDPHIQCAIYAYYVHQRLSQGMTPDEVISAHYTGGYGYSAEYVAQVRQWIGRW